MNKKEIKEEIIRLTSASIEYKNRRNRSNRLKRKVDKKIEELNSKLKNL